MEYYLYKSDDLTHWGIKGMKWGVRRYQRKDGSLTPRGEKRYNKEMAKLRKEEAVLRNREAVQKKMNRLETKRASVANRKKALGDEVEDEKKDAKAASKEAAKNTKKSVKDMSDEELASALNRARMEDAYKQLRPEQEAVAAKKPNKLMNDMIMPAVTTAGKNFLQNALDKAGKNLLKDKVDPDSIEALDKVFKKLDLQQKIDKLKNPDKYLSEEDKNKRQQRAFDAADREAKLAGFKDAADRMQADRDSKAAARKAVADEAARVANEAKSMEYYNSTYRNKGVGEQTSTGSSGKTIAGLLGSGNTSSGSNYVNTQSNRTISGLLGSGDNASSGRKHVTELFSPDGSSLGTSYYEDVD